MISIISFETPIADKYYRNNRSTRQKSLRCFPSCGVKGHVTGGFCGLPLRVKVKFSYQKSAEMNGSNNIESSSYVNSDLGQYVFMAEVRTSIEKKLSSIFSISKTNLIEKIRTKFDSRTNSDGEIFMADVEVIDECKDGSILILQFNSQQCSWDYSWRSNRWSGPNATHVIDIIALKKFDEDFIISSSGSSSPFVIISSHKKYKAKDNDGVLENCCLYQENSNSYDSGSMIDEQVSVKLTPKAKKKKSIQDVAVIEDNLKNHVIKVKKEVHSPSLIYEILGYDEVKRSDSDFLFDPNSFPYRSELEALNASANILISLVKPNSYYYDIQNGRTNIEASEKTDSSDEDKDLGMITYDSSTQNMVALPLKRNRALPTNISENFEYETIETYDNDTVLVMPIKF